MKKIYLSILAIIITSLTIKDLHADDDDKKNNILFTAENKATGNYYPDDQTVILEEIEYVKVVAIPENQLRLMKNRKLKKIKEYLGSYMDASSKKIFNLYGTKKNPDPQPEEPDSDVLTEIAIKNDYGIGE